MMLIERVAIEDGDTTGSLHDKLAALGGKMIVEALTKYQHQQLEAVVQPEDGVTYAAKISKEEAALDWRLSANVLLQRIRAFNPAPGASTQLGDHTLKIWRAQQVAASGPPGQVLSVDTHGVTVACGEHALLLTELQKPGGKRLATANFLQGFPIQVGQQLQLIR